MILSGHDRYWKERDRNYACVEYAAMGAAWLKAEGIYPVHIVAMQNHDQSFVILPLFVFHHYNQVE